MPSLRVIVQRVGLAERVDHLVDPLKVAVKHLGEIVVLAERVGLEWDEACMGASCMG